MLCHVGRGYPWPKSVHRRLDLLAKAAFITPAIHFENAFRNGENFMLLKKIVFYLSTRVNPVHWGSLIPAYCLTADCSSIRIPITGS